MVTLSVVGRRASNHARVTFMTIIHLSFFLKAFPAWRGVQLLLPSDYWYRRWYTFGHFVRDRWEICPEAYWRGETTKKIGFWYVDDVVLPPPPPWWCYEIFTRSARDGCVNFSLIPLERRAAAILSRINFHSRAQRTTVLLIDLLPLLPGGIPPLPYSSRLWFTSFYLRCQVLEMAFQQMINLILIWFWWFYFGVVRFRFPEWKLRNWWQLR